MKKIISLILCTVLVLSFGMVSFANEALVENALENTGINITSVAVADAYEVTVNYTTSDVVTDDTQVAILVYMQDDFDKPTEDNIVYIDQFNNATNGTYTFPMYPDAAEGTYNVVMGATGVDAAGIKTFTIGNVTPEVYGDVTDDDKVRAKDAAWVAQYLANIRTFTTLQEKAADVNKSGGVDAGDISLIKRYVAKLVDTLPYVEVEVATYAE